jgi:hypothetical protein
MKKIIPVFILLMGLAAYIGFYFGQKNEKKDLDLNAFLKAYFDNKNTVKPKWIEIPNETADQMIFNFETKHKAIVKKEMLTGNPNFKGDSIAISDTYTIFTFAARALIAGANKVRFNFAQHDTKSSPPNKPDYNGYLTFVVSAYQDKAKKNIYNGTSTYYDVMTLVPPDNP